MLNAQRTTVPVTTFSTVLSNMANEWCALATDAVSSNTSQDGRQQTEDPFHLSLLLTLLARQRGVEDRIARLARQVREQRRAPRILEAFLARQLRSRRAVAEEVVAARLAFPVLDAMAGRFEFLRAAKRVDGADGFDERVLVVERDLDLEPLDAARVLLQLPWSRRTRIDCSSSATSA